MAYLPDDNDKLLQNQNGQAAGAQPGSTDAGIAGTGVGGAVAGSGGGVSTAGVGSGGTGGWTNIQAYLNANQGNTSSSKLVDNAAGAFDTEKNKLNDSANQAKTQANTEAEKTHIGQDQASKLISEASQAGQGSDAYKQNTGQLKGALSATYNGPQQYGYGIGADTQNVAQGMDQNQFGSYLEGLYRQGAGGQLSNGQLNLQKQLDLDPTASGALENARKAALEKYAGLKSTVDSTVKDTDAAVKAAQNNFGQYKQQLQGYLGDQRGADQNQLGGLVNQFNTAEDQIQNGQNKVGNLASGRQEMVFSNQGGPGSWSGLDKADYNMYIPGERANASNVEGGDPYRNEFNTIADVLNQPEQQIQSGGVTPRHGEWGFDTGGYSKAWDNLLNSMKAQGYTPMTGAMNEDQKKAYLADTMSKADYNTQFNGIAGANPYALKTTKSSGML